MRTLITALGSTMAVALLATPAPASAQAAVEAAMNKAGCLACHAKDKKLVGPAYKDVAAKYKGQADAVAKLSEKIRKGGQGVWGPVPMPPSGADKISDADLKAAVEWVLKQ
ncbi:MAG: c-type cytochrome [Rubrivivax sp.]|jgi:cytochrome c|nr:c-type cytochrome [Rubrivivax sp.]